MALHPGDEAAAERERAHGQMNRLIRSASGRNPEGHATTTAPAAQDGNALAAAFSELEAARASNDDLRIDHAEHVVDRELDAARAAQRPAPARVYFDAGARPTPVQQQSASGSMNDQLRADRLGLHPEQLPSDLRSP